MVFYGVLWRNERPRLMSVDAKGAEEWVWRRKVLGDFDVVGTALKVETLLISKFLHHFLTNHRKCKL